MTHPLAGKKYVFDDGSILEIVQIKDTDMDRGGKLVTYHTSNGHSLPRKYVMPMNEFLEHYKHLFPNQSE